MLSSIKVKGVDAGALHGISEGGVVATLQFVVVDVVTQCQESGQHAGVAEPLGGFAREEGGAEGKFKRGADRHGLSGASVHSRDLRTFFKSIARFIELIEPVP